MRKISILKVVTACLILTSCATTPDTMPPTNVDIFVLDLSTSNDKNSQLKRLNEDLQKSLTANGLGVPKSISNEKISGPVTTIFTFIEDVATKAESFKIQDADPTIKLWNNEFAKDKERNANAWLQVSNAYSSYLRVALQDPNLYSASKCLSQLDENLKEKFISDPKRNRIVNSLCEKLDSLVLGYLQMESYVSDTEAPATDVYGALSKLSRLVDQIKKDSPESIITINIGSDMQHETGDSRDTPAKLRSIDLVRAKACELGQSDRTREGLNFEGKAIVKVNGIGNAQISAEFGNALVRYWECFFGPTAEIR